MTNLRSAILLPSNTHPRVAALLQDRFEIVPLDRKAPFNIPPDVAARVRGAAVSGSFPAAWIDALPNLEIIANFGVGYDGIDLKAAIARGIVVTNTLGVLNDEVADTTVALLINTLRQLPQAENWLRAGRWEGEGPFPLSPLSMRDRHVGFYGLGGIGLEIARRLETFKVKISYHTRSARQDVAYTHYPTLLEMAQNVDTLISIVPKTEQTHKTVNAEIFKALGPSGVLISVGRGWTIDEDALIEALEMKTIAGAGLDVFYDEPRVPAALMAFPNVSLLPHVASASMPTRAAMADLVVDNLLAWFDRRAVLTPVAETPWPANAGV